MHQRRGLDGRRAGHGLGQSHDGDGRHGTTDGRHEGQNRLAEHHYGPDDRHGTTDGHHEGQSRHVVRGRGRRTRDGQREDRGWRRLGRHDGHATGGDGRSDGHHDAPRGRGGRFGRQREWPRRR